MHEVELGPEPMRRRGQADAHRKPPFVLDFGWRSSEAAPDKSGREATEHRGQVPRDEIAHLDLAYRCLFLFCSSAKMAPISALRQVRKWGAGG
jgi:hypothetical protein